jgi:hypothetical protein
MEGNQTAKIQSKARRTAQKHLVEISIRFTFSLQCTEKRHPSNAPFHTPQDPSLRGSRAS